MTHVETKAPYKVADLSLASLRAWSKRGGFALHETRSVRSACQAPGVLSLHDAAAHAAATKTALITDNW